MSGGTFASIPLQKGIHQTVDRPHLDDLRNCGPHGAKDLRVQIGGRVGLKRETAREHLEQHHAKRPAVDLAAVSEATQQLWGHIRWCATDGACWHVINQYPGRAKIDDDWAAICGKHDVLWLQVPMRDA